MRVYVCGKEGWSGDTLFSFPVFNNWILTLRSASLTAWVGRGAIFPHHSHLCSLFTECKAGDLEKKGGRERGRRGGGRREKEEGPGGHTHVSSRVVLEGEIVNPRIEGRQESGHYRFN